MELARAYHAKRHYIFSPNSFYKEKLGAKLPSNAFFSAPSQHPHSVCFISSACFRLYCLIMSKLSNRIHSRDRDRANLQLKIRCNRFRQSRVRSRQWYTRSMQKLAPPCEPLNALLKADLMRYFSHQRFHFKNSYFRQYLPRAVPLAISNASKSLCWLTPQTPVGYCARDIITFGLHTQRNCPLPKRESFDLCDRRDSVSRVSNVTLFLPNKRGCGIVDVSRCAFKLTCGIYPGMRGGLSAI